MKTLLPDQIKTVSEAKAFLTSLHANGESYHPEDDANSLCGDPFTKEEGDKLNKLMIDIYHLDGNDGNHINPKFCPCGFLLLLDEEYIKNRLADTNEFTHTLSDNIVTILEVEGDNYTLAFGNHVIDNTFTEIVILFRCGQYKF